MARFVRCPSGHVYDSAAGDVCPKCGAVSASAPPPDVPVETTVDAKAEPDPAPKPKTWMMVAGGAGALAVLIAVLLFARTAPAPPKATETVSADPQSDPDFKACLDRSGGIAACDRAIVSKKFSGALLARAYSWRAIGKQGILKYDDAIVDMLEAARLDPRNVEYVNMVGILNYQLGKPDAALKSFEQALKLDPNNPVTYAQMGQVHTALKDYDKAKADLDRSIELNSQQAFAYKYRADVYRLRGESDKARSDYQQAIANNTNESIKKILADALAALGPGNSAQQVPGQTNAGSSLKSDPLWQACYNAGPNEKESACSAAISSGKFGGTVLADLYSLRGAAKVTRDREGAVADFSEALKADPKHAVALGNRGEMFRRGGDLDRAIADLDGAIALDAKAAFLMSRGRVHAARGDQDKAVQDFDRVIALTPDDPHAYQGRADAYRRGGDREKAVRDYDKALALNPDAKTKSDIEAALYVIRPPAAAPPPPPAAPAVANNQKQEARLSFDRGAAYLEKNDYDNAIKEFDQAIKLDPKQYDAWQRRGLSYQQKGQLDEALDDYSQALSLNPTDTATVKAMEDIARKLKERDFDYAVCLSSTSNGLDACNRAIEGKKYKGQELANLLNARGNYAPKGSMEALGSYLQAINQAPSDPAGYGNRGLYYLGHGFLDKALQDFDRAIALRTDKAAVFMGRGAALARKKQFDKAIPDLDRAIGLDPKNIEALLWRAKSHRDIGDRDKAVADFQTILSLGPGADIRMESEAALKELGVSDTKTAPGAAVVKKSGLEPPPPVDSMPAGASHGARSALVRDLL